MADIKYYDVILKPVITEKSMNAMGDRKYTFMVHVDANKSMIKEAVEKMFPGTKVASVNTMNCEGKTKRRGMTFGKTAASKKAIVKLTEDSKEIEIFQGLLLPVAVKNALIQQNIYPPDTSGRRTYTASGISQISLPKSYAVKRKRKGVKCHGN